MLAVAWTVVVLVAAGIGIAIVSSADETPTRVDSETSIRPLVPPAVASVDDPTTTTTKPEVTTTTTVPTTAVPTTAVPTTTVAPPTSPGA